MRSALADTRVEWLSRTVFVADDPDVGHAVAQALLARVLAVCQEVRRDFTDPEFGPAPASSSSSSSSSSPVADGLLAALQAELPPGSYQDIERSIDQQAKLREGRSDLPAGPVDPAKLVWVSRGGGGQVVVKKQGGPSAVFEKGGSVVAGRASAASYPVQGALADRWLLGAMCVVAVSRPRLLRRIFVTPPPSVGGRKHKTKTNAFKGTRKQQAAAAAAQAAQAAAEQEVDGLGPVPASSRDAYVVRVFHDFRWHFVLIDGRVPSHAQSKAPAFGRCADPGEMWVSLAEKAVAKLSGGYGALHHGGTVDAGMHLLTGCCTHTLHGAAFRAAVNDVAAAKDGDAAADDRARLARRVAKENATGSARRALFGQLRAFLAAGFLVGCERRTNLAERARAADASADGRKSPMAPTTAFLDRRGLLAGHSYVVVDAVDVRGTQLVRLVNPWHCGEFRGEWTRGTESVEENLEELAKGFSEVVRRDEFGRVSQHAPAFFGQDALGQPAYPDPKTSSGFLMSFDELMGSMSHVFVGFVDPVGAQADAWTVRSVCGAWNVGVGGGRSTAGGAAHPGADLGKWARNPRYQVIVPQPAADPKELERRKRTAIKPKTPTPTVLVLLRQARKPLAEATVGLRFCKTGSVEISKTVPHSRPGVEQPYHTRGTAAAGLALGLPAPTTIDVVPDNLRANAAARFRISVVCLGSDVELRSGSAGRRGAAEGKSGANTTSVRVAVLAEEDTETAVGEAGQRDPVAIPEDRLPAAESAHMRARQQERQQQFQRRLELDADAAKLTRGDLGVFAGPASAEDVDPGVAVDASLDLWRQSQKMSGGTGGAPAGGDETSPPPAYQEAAAAAAAKASAASKTDSRPPPPPYTRVAVSPQKAELRARVQAALLDSPMRGGLPGYGSAAAVSGDEQCAVVFRGGLMMPTMDSTSAPRKRDGDGRDGAGGEAGEADSFVLATVQEIVQPYTLVFSVEHPGTRVAAERRFGLRGVEAILMSPTDGGNVNAEAAEAVDQWIETGVLPRHDHLAVWFASQMTLDLGGGGIYVEAIDGPLASDQDGEDEDSDEGGPFSDMERHDVLGGDVASVASSWDEEGDGTDEEADNNNNNNTGGDLWAQMQGQRGGDEALAPGDDGNGENDETGRGRRQASEGDSLRPQLPPSDPFVLASLHAGTVLKELQAQDAQRKRVAKVREEVILQRARRLRAATEYQRDVSRLQHEEIGKAIMRQTVAVGVEATLKCSDVQDEKRKRELRRITNPFKHNPSEKWIKGPFLGEGPLPARTMDAPRKQARRARENSKFVYDAHGRRVERGALGRARTGPPVEHAMDKLRQAAMTNSAHYLDIRDLFDRADTEKNGFLSRAEMLAAVQSLGVTMTDEESAALCDHFDANGNGTIHYSEFAFAFFNRRSLISKWRMARGPGMRSEAAIMTAFRKYDYDGSGKLERDEFERCLNEMNVVLSPLEFQILAERFDTNGDGFIQPKEFLAFMRRITEDDAKARKEHRDKVVSNTLLDEVRSTAAAASRHDEGRQKRQRNAEARALQAKVKAQEDEIRALEEFIALKQKNAARRRRRK